MTTIVCTGLDGANPLHMLASLGLLRLADRIAPGAKLGWRFESGAWRPVLDADQERDVLLTGVATWLNALARKSSQSDPSLNRRVRELSTSLKRARENAKEQMRQAREEAKLKNLRGTEAKRHVETVTAPCNRSIVEQETTLAVAREALAKCNGSGIAHFGDVIGVSPGIVRRAGDETVLAFLAAAPPGGPRPDDPALVVSHLPALACDQVTEGGRVSPTPFSFGNGAGGQCLLKDFCACASRVTACRVQASITGKGERIVKGQTGLNWDPKDQRSYALAWDNPEGTAKLTDVAANALAYIGLGFLPCMPVGNRIVAVGWQHEVADWSWTWPIWDHALPLPVVRSLLASAAILDVHPDARKLRSRGVVETRRCQRLSVNKRFFFSPSRSM